MIVTGMLVDVDQKSVFPASLHFDNGIITRVEKSSEEFENFILPGLIDSHIHVESSMITPGIFAREVVKHGTIGVVSDPHEIANVLGIDGVEYMIKDARKVPVKFWFGAPSCVPATKFETNGASIDSNGVKYLLEKKEIKYLSEMMNFPGILFNDEEVWKKVEIAKKLRKTIDGHAPGLSGDMLRKYISAGIATDHECISLEEAKEKISHGMKVLIREGSAARNLEPLKELFTTNPEMIMLCSDDLHPEMLLSGHIDKLISKLIADGFDLFDIIRSCTVNPVTHYGLESGWLKPGQPADFIIVNDYKRMNVLETWIDGEKVFDRGTVLFKYEKGDPINKFHCSEIKINQIEIPRTTNKMLVIEAFDGELLTKKIMTGTGTEKETFVVSDTVGDILKIVVKDRYKDAPPAVGFIKGFGLRNGAFASSVAHDSHNIICIGTNDEDMVSAINEIIHLKGGLSVSIGGKVSSLKLNIAGIMSDNSCEKVASEYKTLSEKVIALGSGLKAPFMTLSFMALLVIPELKIGDRGLFDVNQFKLVRLTNE